MFLRLSLGAKIGGGFGLVLLASVALGATGILTLNYLRHAQLDNGRAIEIRRTMYDARLAATRFLIKFDAKDAEACRVELQKVQRMGGDLQPDLTTGEGAALGKLIVLVDAYRERLGELEDVTAAAKQIGQSTDAIPGVAERVTAWRAVGVDMVGQMGMVNTAVADRMAQVNTTAMTTMVAILVCVLVTGVLLAWRITCAIINPIQGVRRSLGALAKGDLTQQTAVMSRDEVGAMAADLNHTVDGLRGMVGTISHGAQAIASSAEEMTAVSKELTVSAGTMSTQSGSVAASATEVSQSISSFATGVEEMNASVTEIAHNATQAATVAKEGVDASVRAHTAMQSLERSSAEIGEIVKLITGIAEQTNLLALNATIEAARAGDAGRGFAVVAAEVKELARRTGDATSDIRNRVAGIQRDTHIATGAIGQLREISDRVSALQQSIASAVEEQSATTRELAGNIAQVSQGGSDIARNIIAVAEAAKSANAGAHDTSSSALELSRLAAELQKVIQRFTVA